MSRRTGRMSLRLSSVMSLPRKVILPSVGLTSLMIARAVVDLPHPDSPTKPRVSAWPTSKEIPSTA